MKINRLVVCLWLLTFFGSQSAADADAPASFPVEEKVLIMETFHMARQLCESVWPGWKPLPFPVLLLADERSFLFHYPSKPDGFESYPDAPDMGGPVYVRNRQFPPNLLATFPAFGLIPVVVVGTPEKTGKTPLEWVITLLHEHFHQYQMMAPGYFEAVQKLIPARGDETGQWMLTYPFPYDDPGIGQKIRRLGKQLAALLRRPDRNREAFERFRENFRTFLKGLRPGDRQYFSFQVWQEGVARYVEVRVAEVAAGAYQPSLDFKRWFDKESFANVAQRLRARMMKDISNIQLSQTRRVTFYSFGAAVAFLMDKMSLPWKTRYLEHRFHFGDDWIKGGLRM